MNGVGIPCILTLESTLESRPSKPSWRISDSTISRQSSSVQISGKCVQQAHAERVTQSDFFDLTRVQFAEMGLLGDFDAVCVSEYQIDKLRWSTVPTSSGETSPSVLLRAGQAQYPTNFLTVEGGFIKLLSSESRNLIKDIMDGGLKEIKEKMGKIEAAVVSEVDRQFKVGTMKLKELYAVGDTPKAKKTGTPPSLDKVFETRNVAKDSEREELLAIMECILGTDYRDSDEDEVF
jgi:hypothetical protein